MNDAENPTVKLRAVQPDDIPILHQHQLSPEAN